MSVSSADLHRALSLRSIWTRPPASTVAGALGLVGLAVLAGVSAAIQPLIVLAPLGAVALLVLAFRAPVTHLTLLLLVTLVVGYALQHRLGSHLLPSDAFLLTGMLRASVVLMRQRLEPRRLLVLGVMTAFCALTVLQVVHGLRAGYNSSQVGDEARDLLGFGALLIAFPILSEPQGRIRLGRGLIVVGLALGMWGLTTWALGISLGQEADVGLRTYTNFATSGRGQLHGGLYGYPVAVIMSATMLLSGSVRSGLARGCLAVVLGLNLIALALTYERTFWLTTAVTLAFVIAKMTRGRRFRAAVTVVTCGLALLGLLATLSPATLGKLEARVMTLGQASSDDSLRYRNVETGLVLLKVHAKPLTGWGLGDTLYWGQPWDQVPPSSTWFSHNGYLWVVWKVGVIQAALLFGLLAWALLLRAPPGENPALRSMRVGAQGGLLVLLLSSWTFPSFNSLTITAVMGVLIAICFMPPTRRAKRPPRPEAGNEPHDLTRRRLWVDSRKQVWVKPPGGA